MGLDGEAEVDLLDSNGNVISFRNHSVLISVDVPNDEEIRRIGYLINEPLIISVVFYHLLNIKCLKRSIEKVRELRRGSRRHKELF